MVRDSWVEGLQDFKTAALQLSPPGCGLVVAQMKGFEESKGQLLGPFHLTAVVQIPHRELIPTASHLRTSCVLRSPRRSYLQICCAVLLSRPNGEVRHSTKLTRMSEKDMKSKYCETEAERTLLVGLIPVPTVLSVPAVVLAELSRTSRAINRVTRVNTCHPEESANPANNLLIKKSEVRTREN